LKICFSAWNCSLLGNNVRDFMYKCRNNYLPLNNRVAAYDRNVCPMCTFCRIRDPDTVTRESFNHLFYSCDSTSIIINDILRVYFALGDINENDRKKFVWTGITDGNDDLQHVLIIFWELVRYSIYKYKLKKRIPNSIMIANETFFNIKTTLLQNLALEQTIRSSLVLARWLPALG
jgi:hypothetical protein